MVMVSSGSVMGNTGKPITITVPGTQKTVTLGAKPQMLTTSQILSMPTQTVTQWLSLVLCIQTKQQFHVDSKPWIRCFNGFVNE